STPGAFLRAALVGLAGAALTALVAHNNDAGGSLAFALAMSAPFLIVAVGGIVEAVIAGERGGPWLRATTRPAPPRGPAAAALAGGAAAGGPAGFVYGTAAGAVIAGAVGGGLALVAAEAVWGAALAVLVSAGERLATRAEERNGGLAVTYALVVAGAAVVGA